jgi:hypothetical protein
VLSAGPVYVFHNGGKLRLQAEEIAQLLGAGFEQGGLGGAGDLAEILIPDHDAAGELDDSGTARERHFHAHGWQEHAVLGGQLDRTRRSRRREHDSCRRALCVILSLVVVIGVKS